MKYLSLCMLITIASSITACSEKPQGVLTNNQQQTLNKAKQTEDVLNKANEERLKKVDEITGQ